MSKHGHLSVCPLGSLCCFCSWILFRNVWWTEKFFTALSEGHLLKVTLRVACMHELTKWKKGNSKKNLQSEIGGCGEQWTKRNKFWKKQKTFTIFPSAFSYSIFRKTRSNFLNCPNFAITSLRPTVGCITMSRLRTSIYFPPWTVQFSSVSSIGYRSGAMHIDQVRTCIMGGHWVERGSEKAKRKI